MYLKLNGMEMQCSEADRWMDLLDRLPDGGAGALGIGVQGQTYGLAEPVVEYAQGRILTYDDEEGRRIYERSLLLTFLAATERCFPGVDVRMEHSHGQGVYIVGKNFDFTEPVCRQIDGEMRRLVAEERPIRKRTVSTSRAEAYYGEHGQSDRMRLLKYRKYSQFTLYDIDGCEDYFYGKMTPTTGPLKVFRLIPYGRGVMLMRPDRAHPSRPADFQETPRLWRIYGESSRWQSRLKCENVADLNDLIAGGGLREFIRVNEALHEGRLHELVNRFEDSGARLILIAGPSSSGKTTFANRLSTVLRSRGLVPVKLSMDDYYRNRSEITPEPDGTLDLERPDTLDVALLGEHLRRLMKGEEVQVPEFDFTVSARSARTHSLQLRPDQILIIEGIHGLNESMTRTIPAALKFKIYISALTTLNLDDHNRIHTADVRLLRRIVRDHHFRNTRSEDTMQMWGSVRRGEEKYIFPYQEQADVMFNSALNYELAIMRRYAYPLLCEVQPESPYYTAARRMVKFLNYILPADAEDEVPGNSILREFIGGSCFYR